MTASPAEIINTGKKSNVKTGASQYDPTNRLARRLRLLSKTEGMSEYQAAYRKYPFQRPRNSVRPVSNKMDNGKLSLMMTTYQKDYVFHEDKNTFKMESFKPLQSYRPSSAKFSDQTIYSLSYQRFDKDVVKSCRPASAKPSEPQRTKYEVTIPDKPSAEGDAKKAEEVPKEKEIVSTDVTNTKPEPQVPEPVVEPPKLEAFTTKIAVPGRKMQYAPFNGMTTYTADYVTHSCVPRQPICKPPTSNNHYDLGPFDGRTTQNTTYKAWPVIPIEKPTWAIKPEYQRPLGGMPFSSTYMADFENPKSLVERIMPIKPKTGKDIIKHEGGNGDQTPCTTYQGHYVAWKGALPAKTYQIKQLYVPTAGEMDCQSIQRLHFRGVQTERPNLCHKSSEHRNLNDDKRMYFNTTYRDTFFNRARPKSCPVGI
ncbi:stabilizer of axonemal microtubules 1-like [Saccostrea cucullata]|uniref:stabilizer of axonemal microtubules 1-like n=1 Tax=Saccostrea cuccullata TaxID=36930 RepID=UPI002ED3D54D